MRLLVFLLLLGTFDTPYPLYADEAATVVRVIDGDTVVVRIGNAVEHVRLVGIDAPEMKDRSAGVAQCYAREAKKELRRHTAHSPIILQRDSKTKNRDAYGRLLRIIKVTDASQKSINEMMIQGGLARVTSARFPFSERGRYIQDQKNSQSRRVGLWAACSRKSR